MVNFIREIPLKFFLKKNQPWNFVSKIPSRTDKLETIFEKIIPVVRFWKFFQRPPTCPKFNTHKKVVVHFFILMLLLPKTPPLTYPKRKKFKGPKMDHFTHFTSLHFHNENRWGNSPTCPKFYSHKKVVLHFFILMLLLPKTPPLTYLRIKKFKGPKLDHFSHF